MYAALLKSVDLRSNLDRGNNVKRPMEETNLPVSLLSKVSDQAGGRDLQNKQGAQSAGG